MASLAALQMQEQGGVALRLLRFPRIDLALWICGTADPTQEFWNEAIRRLAACHEATGHDAKLHCLVVTDGGAPNAGQRAQLLKLSGDKVPFAVVTDSLDNPLKRGIATALTWVFPQIAFFNTKTFSGALRHIGASAHHDRIWAELQSMAPHHATIRRIAAHAEARPSNDLYC